MKHQQHIRGTHQWKVTSSSSSHQLANISSMRGGASWTTPPVDANFKHSNSMMKHCFESPIINKFFLKINYIILCSLHKIQTTIKIHSWFALGGNQYQYFYEYPSRHFYKLYKHTTHNFIFYDFYKNGLFDNKAFLITCLDNSTLW